MNSRQCRILYEKRRYGKSLVFIKNRMYKTKNGEGREVIVHGPIFENRSGKIVYAGKLLEDLKGKFFISHKKPFSSTFVPYRGKDYGPVSYMGKVPEIIRGIILLLFHAPLEKLEEIINKELYRS